ncbi:hypothetical protein B5S30_g4223 [[Candida] boidinii]|nr:hypothetical protein B5S30_g4223 [[Candida] boidinii]
MNTNAHSIATASLTKPCPFSTSSNATHLLVSHNTQFPSNSFQFKNIKKINSNNSQDAVLTSKRHHSTCSRYTRLAENMCGSTVYVTGRQILPTNVKPTHYNVTLEPLFDSFTFNGEVKIELKVNETSDSIALHTVDIKILETLLSTSSATGSVKPLDSSYIDDDQSTVFKFPEGTLVKDETVTLTIKFIGELNDMMAGFYRSTYEENGETKYLATTQMEPTDCRRAFPCFDEPALKATFDVSLIADKKFTCLSNMDVKEEVELGDDRKKVSFNTTPKMSTYLVAFIVGDLKYIEADYNYRIPVRVYTTPGLETQGRFSVELAAKTLEFFENKFDIDYPLPKMDMVAIHDFSAGAMENFGLVTYRVVDLLFDEKKSTLATKQRVAEVVQHELAHQWFGNLVTMDWWEGLWLNEGFATWMSWYSCNTFFPEWKVWEQYVTDSLQHALSLDSLRASHPVEVPVKRADEINQIFDAISYSKGSSLLKMLANWLGEDVFVKGVSNYLKKHKYGNTVTSDLWEALSETSGKDVVKVMDIWTKKVGFPVISVKEDGNTISVKQNRYLTTGDVKPEEDTVIYPVFLALKSSEGLDESVVLNERESTIELKDRSFFKLNGNTTGIYRVAYTPERWAQLGEDGKNGLLSVEDRAGLVADAGALSTSGYSSTSNLLSLVSGWKSETSFIVWDEILTRVASVKAAWIFENEETNAALRSLTRDLVSEKCHKLGWKFDESEPFLEQRLKSLLFGASASSKDEKVVAACKDMFAKYVAGDKEAIHPNLRATIFNTVAAEGSAAEYEEILKIYRNPQSVDEKIAALRSLGRFENKELLEKTLALLLDGTVRSQDIYIPMQGMRAHKVGIETLFAWMKVKWDVLYQLLPPGLSMLGSVVTLCTSGFTSPEKYKEIEEFFKGKDTKGYNQGLSQSLDTIQSKTTWIKRDGKSVDEWLSVNGYKVPAKL